MQKGMNIMNIKITADSTCDLSPELCEKYGVTMLPLYIVKDGKSYKDMVEITPTDIFNHVATGGAITSTAAINVDDYINYFKPLSDSNDGVIHIDISAEFSSCHQNARIAAQDFDNVYVVDSRNLSTGSGLVVLKAAEYIENYEKDEPLFAWVSFSGPHYTFDAPEEYLKKVDGKKLPPLKRREGEWKDPARIHHDSYFGGNRANIDGCGMAQEHACKNYTDAYWDSLRVNYCANVKLIDDQIGRILEAVRRKYGDNAMLIFTADHGEMLGSHGLWGKHNCAYEEVWHIPLLIRYPGQKEKASDSRLVNSTDLLPTCLRAGNIPIPACDGKPLQDQSWKREYTFAEGEGYLAVTDGRYKYVHVQKGEEQGRELLDLVRDPDEFENKIEREEYQKALAELRGRLIEHLLPSVLA